MPDHPTPERGAPHALRRWGYFVALSVGSAALALGLYAVVLRTDALDPALAVLYRWLRDHPFVTGLMAFSPLFAVMLVGWGYAQRARRRRKQLADS
ncbi:MAG: hypothetical protein HY908_20755 [Myxococcales bacterium]|nr:hypothetical protein [Myxococcales bacterium]